MDQFVCICSSSVGIHGPYSHAGEVTRECGKSENDAVSYAENFH